MRDILNKLWKIIVVIGVIIDIISGLMTIDSYLENKYAKKEQHRVTNNYYYNTNNNVEVLEMLHS
ncbi:hypothetical protein [Romboutsia sp.]|uniref:hypothetical protein n=1 Tax=Romboutsia sp. TaxID=1965302 RepID=UPI002C17B3C7|nr:hypothetical protein [Romboutsia sp.]HSQ89454.1 hypothetical protein [Romboutsia sp.]